MDEARQFIDKVSGALLWALLAVTIIGVAGSPFLVWAMASGLAANEQAHAAAIAMTRFMFPYILLISLVALSAGILNTWKRFAVPAFTPVLLNVAVILAAWQLAQARAANLCACRRRDGGRRCAARHSTARAGSNRHASAGAVKSAARIWRSGGARDAHPDGASRTGRLGGATKPVDQHAYRLAFGRGLRILGVLWRSLDGVSTALLGVALGTVLLPTLAGAREQHDTGRYSELLDWGLRLCLLLAVPCTVGLALMAKPLTALLFHYGRFSAHDLEMTSLAVLAYSLGLVGLIAVKVLAPGFYAQHDIRTPVRIALGVLVITQLLNLIFVPVFQHAGLALSISVAAWLNAALLLRGLLQRGTYRPAPGWLSFLAKIAGAALLMGVLLAMATPKLDWVSMQHTPWLRVAWGLGLVAIAAALYLAVLLAAGIRPKQFLRRG